MTRARPKQRAQRKLDRALRLYEKALDYNAAADECFAIAKRLVDEARDLTGGLQSVPQPQPPSPAGTRH